jgi:acyl-coenzyme A synthetase/AMP-(fatty) acid ligase
LPIALAPAEIAERAGSAGVHAIFGAPFHFDLLSRLPGYARLPPLRLAVSSGDLVRPALYEEFRARFGVGIGQAYGTTEAGLIAADPAGRYPPPSLGLPAPGVKIRIVEGELRVRVPPTTVVYDGADPPSRQRWLRTHDRIERAADGRLLFRGRSGSYREVDGVLIDLAEVENVLHEHDLVTEAVAFFDGSAVEAYVSISSPVTPDELTGFCADRLDRRAVPRVLRLARAGLPRTRTGKLVRARELFRSADPREA